MTKIISAFAGSGKSTAAKMTCWRVRDSDSDEFQFIRTGLGCKLEDPAWPQNFIDHAVTEFAKGDFDAILLSAYIALLPAIASRIPLIYVYPSLDMKDEFEMRYRNRNNPEWLVKFFMNHFDEWVTALSAMNGRHVVLKPGQYLTDVLPDILAKP